MEHDRERLEELTRGLARLYFEKRDYAQLMEFIGPKVSCFGTGEGEVCRNFIDTLQYIKREQVLFSGNYTVSRDWYHVTIISKNLACVMAAMDVTATEKSDSYPRCIRVRFSVVYSREDGKWQICHIHNSVPYGDQDSASFFDREEDRDYGRIQSIAHKLVEEQLAVARMEDTLTGILNFEGFIQRAQERMDEYPNHQYAVMKFDINKFGYINQTYGYDVGDAMLRDIGQRLSCNCNTIEVCGRIEKESFAMLMQFKTVAELDKRMWYLEKEITDNQVSKKLQAPISLVGGIYLPKRGNETVKEMLDKAQIAQKSVMLKGKSHYAYFSQSRYNMEQYNARLIELAPTAMGHGEFKLFLQPQVDLRTMEVVSAEALVRWIRPDKTLIMPDNFISLFEREGQIINFDFYMLELLCQHLRKWIDTGIVIKPISINQSRLHIKTPDYLKRFCNIVDKYEIPHNYLAFELTESAFTDDRKAMLRLANNLRKNNFQLELDDFGSGYASLDIISTLYADVLKLDRSLVVGLDNGRNERSMKVLQKVIEMAHETEMEVVCEGVETQQQVNCIRKLGCDIAQGFYFYRPMPAEEFERTILMEKEPVCLDACGIC